MNSENMKNLYYFKQINSDESQTTPLVEAFHFDICDHLFLPQDHIVHTSIESNDIKTILANHLYTVNDYYKNK